MLLMKGLVEKLISEIVRDSRVNITLRIKFKEETTKFLTKTLIY